MRNIIIILLFFWNMSVLFGQMSAKEYIDQYKNVALQQMSNTDVPASISLAQGIIESKTGKGVLAQQANNHFGVECTTKWEGEVLYKTKNGEQICYKIYNSPAESYIDHTVLLSNNPQFQNLFYIEAKNYKRWAKGLEALKYSTIPDYATQLIQTIELYELYNIDNNVDVYQDEIDIIESGDADIPYKSNEDILYINNVKAVIANGEETPLEFAARMKLPLRKVLKYNDILLSQNFRAGQYIFLGRKKSKFKGDKDIHEVKENEDMYWISQLYGIRLSKLLKMNKLKREEEPKIGEKIYLKSKTTQKPVLRSSKFVPSTKPPTVKPKTEEPTTTPPVRITTPPISKPTTTNTTVEKPTKPEIQQPTKPNSTNTELSSDGNIIYVYPDDPTYNNGESGTNDNITTAEIPSKPTSSTPQKPSKPTTVAANVHLVEKGETLYSISKKYSVTVQRLKDLNGLLSNEIEINQQLRYQ